MTNSPPPDPSKPGIERLREVMARLRDKQNGCPWDLEQNFQTIALYTIEEAYEVADAIARADMGALKEELGDLLLQVVYHAQRDEIVARVNQFLTKGKVKTAYFTEFVIQ